VREMACSHCGKRFDMPPIVCGLLMGGYVTLRCAACWRATVIPWGRCGLQLIEHARNESMKNHGEVDSWIGER